MSNTHSGSGGVGRDERIDRLLRDGLLGLALQPIVDLQAAETVGFEALARPTAESGFDGPWPLFAAAAAEGRIAEVETAARRTAFGSTSQLRSDELLFVNNSAAMIIEPDFAERAAAELREAGGPPPHRVVMEITEQESAPLEDELLSALIRLRRAGFRLAIDDVGAGVNGLARLAAIRPDWVKLDRKLVAGVDVDPFKQNLLRCFVRFARFAGLGLVAEGIERVGELEALIGLGVTHGQGFFLGMPAWPPAHLAEDVREEIVRARAAACDRGGANLQSIKLRSLARPIESRECSTPIAAVQDELRQRSTSLSGVVLLDGRRYVGWLERQTILDAEPADGRTLGDLSAKAGASVSSDCTVAEALEVACSLLDFSGLPPLVMHRDGEVRGAVTIQQLLLSAAQSREHRSSHVAPITGLPSRVQCDRWLAEAIRRHDPVDVVFVDIQGFDAYNAAYGVAMGDEMLRRLGGLLEDTVDRLGRDRAFVGHIGSDQFLLAARGLDRDEMIRLQHQFELVRAEFFNHNDLEQGAYETEDAQGCRRRRPLSTLRVLLLSSPLLGAAEPREIHALARRLRHASTTVGRRGQGALLVTDRPEGIGEGRRSA